MITDNGASRDERQELTNRQERIREILNRTFAPVELDIRDDSGRHAGHSGAQPEGETHYILTIRADAFAGRSRVDIHRAINKALAGEFETGLHALVIKASGTTGDTAQDQ